MTPVQKLIMAALVAIACFSTWKVDTWRYGRQLAALNAAHQVDL